MDSSKQGTLMLAIISFAFILTQQWELLAFAIVCLVILNYDFVSSKVKEILVLLEWNKKSKTQGDKNG